MPVTTSLYYQYNIIKQIVFFSSIITVIQICSVAVGFDEKNELIFPFTLSCISCSFSSKPRTFFFFFFAELDVTFILNSIMIYLSSFNSFVIIIIVYYSFLNSCRLNLMTPKVSLTVYIKYILYIFTVYNALYICV